MTDRLSEESNGPGHGGGRGLVTEDAYVYVAGPLSDSPPEYLANVARMSRAARRMTRLGLVPINPAADLVEGLIDQWPLSVEDYQARSMSLLRLLAGRRGCLYVIARVHDDGRESAGVAAEIAEAGRLGIPLFESEVDLLRWAVA